MYCLHVPFAKHIICLEKSRESIDEVGKLINEFNKVAVYILNENNQLHYMPAIAVNLKVLSVFAFYDKKCLSVLACLAVPAPDTLRITERELREVKRSVSCLLQSKRQMFEGVT